jgi:hypothetical protein
MPNGDGVALPHFFVEPLNEASFPGGPKNRAVIFVLQRRYTGRVVGMMMGDKDFRQPPAFLGECRRNRTSLWCIDSSGRARIRIMN